MNGPSTVIAELTFFPQEEDEEGEYWTFFVNIRFYEVTDKTEKMTDWYLERVLRRWKCRDQREVNLINSKYKDTVTVK